MEGDTKWHKISFPRNIQETFGFYVVYREGVCGDLRVNESKFLCEANILKNGVNGLTMGHKTPSCEGCSLRCGLGKERVASVEVLTGLTKQDLVAVVTKVYGFPLAVLGAVLLFESVVFSIDSIGLLLILLSILPASIFLMAQWAKRTNTL